MNNKRILIFYMSPKSGHYTAARAMKACFYQMYPQTDVMDVNFLNYTNPVIERILFRSYMRVIKSAPTIWDYMYDNQKLMDRMAWMQEFSRMLHKSKLRSLIRDFKPDAILNTQCFPCGVLSVFKEQGDFLNIPNIAIITDYVVNNYWIYDHVDQYIVPAESMIEKLLSKNVPKERIKNYGIPVHMKFRSTHDRSVLMHKFNLDQDKKTLLVMGGNYGFGNIKKLVVKLSYLKEDFQMVVITGHNEKLFKKLNKIYTKLQKTLRVLEYVNNVDELMEIADVILTKPGGITTAECLVKRLPMVIINPIPGQETRNCEYLVSKNVAEKALNELHAVEIVRKLFANPHELERMKKNTDQIRRPSAAMNIVEMVMDH
ncbi:hypothetical protein IID04_01485 [PVC group bacterium]|nr:hypothetical protein [PVC group bacterium]